MQLLGHSDVVIVSVATDLLPLVNPSLGCDELILELSDLLLHSNQLLFKAVSLKGTSNQYNQDALERRIHLGAFLLHQHPEEGAVN